MTRLQIIFYVVTVFIALGFCRESGIAWGEERATSPASAKKTPQSTSQGTHPDSTTVLDATGQSPDYVDKVQDILDVGLTMKKGNWETAKKQYESLLRLDKDPRLCYAWAIVCLKQSKNDDAIKALQLAIQCKGPAYLPAWQLLARTQAIKGQFPAAMGTIRDLARVMENRELGWSDEQSKNECATWCGRMTAFILTKGDKSPPLGALSSRYNAEIVKVLKNDRRKAYENGKQEPMVSQTPAVSTTELQNHSQELKKTKLDQSTKDRDEVKEKQDKLASQSQTIKENYKNQFDQFDQELEKMETFYGNLLAECRFHTANISALESQLNYVNREREKAEKDSDSGYKTDKYFQQNLQLTSNINAERSLLTLTMTRAKVTVQKTMILIQNRNQLIAQYQKTYQEILGQSENLEAWEKRIAGKIRTLEQTPNTQGANPSAPPEVISVATCFPIDYAVEKQKILDSFSQVAK